MNRSQINDPRFWEKWRQSGAIGTIDNKVESALARAREFADKGDVLFIHSLQNAQTSAERTGEDISARVADIEEVGYKKAVPVLLEKAREVDERGNDFSFMLYLPIAQIYAQEIGLDISAQVAEIVPVLLEKAKKSAEKRNVYEFTSYLLGAQYCAQTSGLDISKEVAEIEEAGSANGVTIKLERVISLSKIEDRMGVINYLIDAQIQAQPKHDPKTAYYNNHAPVNNVMWLLKKIEPTTK